MALLHTDFYSESLGMCMQVDVILPEETHGQIGMEGKAADTYPTLYLLHGMSDDQTIWQRRTSIERYAAEKGIAVVMPGVHLSWYTDMKLGFRYWTYVSEELPRLCRMMFPRMSKRREDTFVAGLSMGGYGAMKCALRASDTFSCAASLSGALDIVSHLEGQPESGLFYDIFGTSEETKGSFNDLFAAASEMKESGKPLPKLYIWCGTEDFLYGHNVRMRAHLEKLGYDLTYEESSGDHQWKYWDQKIQDVINWLPLEGRKA